MLVYFWFKARNKWNHHHHDHHPHFTMKADKNENCTFFYCFCKIILYCLFFLSLSLSRYKCLLYCVRLIQLSILMVKVELFYPRFFFFFVLGTSKCRWNKEHLLYENNENLNCKFKQKNKKNIWKNTIHW